ncbi:MAG: hypothetical protein MZV63_36175 [Marinilabiliales bacterium]|nr:hypothetical protein [Marinilabiliales bacterium]
MSNGVRRNEEDHPVDKVFVVFGLPVDATGRSRVPGSVFHGDIGATVCGRAGCRRASEPTSYRDSAGRAPTVGRFLGHPGSTHRGCLMGIPVAVANGKVSKCVPS